MRSRVARLAAASMAAALAVAGCGSLDEGDDTPDAGSTSAGTIKVGYVSPQSGALAPFGEADSYVVQQMTDYFAKNPIKVGDRTYSVSITLKDSQSDSKRAAEVTTDLINTDGVDIVLATSTPDTTNPVADQCEANGVPCITSVAPWQPWYFGRGAKEGTKFQWTYHFFWGLEDVIGVYQDMWDQVPTNKSAAALWPNDPDGTAWGSKETGFAPAISPNGYTIVDPGFYPNGTQDFTAQISQFKSAKAEVLLGVPIPPDFTTFWKQAKQQGYTPKIATIGKALLFPSSVEALGADGQNLGTEVWWSPNHPFTSSLTQQSAKDLADAYSESTGKQWTQPLGFAHAVFEVMAAAYTNAGSTDKKAVADALGTLNVSTVVGPVDFTKGPVPNVAKTPLVGGQWRAGADGKYDLVIVSNSLASNIPSAGKVEALS